MSGNKLSRRDFLKLTGATAAAVATGSLGKKSALAFPNIKRRREAIKLGVGGWAVESITALLEQLEFTKQTGIEVEVITRPGAPDEMITQIAAGAQANNSPYDVIDFEDELAITMSRAGWIRGLDDLLPSDFWEDWPEAMLAMVEVWDRYNGETFRIHHNYEACYWWYRKDWFDEKGVEVPKTWEEVAAMGEIFTDEEKGVWATVEGMASGAFLNVYLAWVTLQAGGNPFDVGEEFRTALQYIYDLMYTYKTLNPASLQKDYDQQNADYLADRVAFMRQWPFFWSISRGAKDWYAEGKAEIALPPVGPGGAANSTYAAGWGWGIPKHSRRQDEAAELVKFLIDKDNAVKMAQYDVWYLSARHSVLAAVGDQEGIPAALKMYSDAGVIGTRPFHEKFVEALNVLEQAASAYLTKQISLDEAINQAQSRMARL
jgi:ABC-type glycerol-3-phosphate transport system substrate-binding protein